MLSATPRRQAAAVVLIVMCTSAALLWGCSGGNSPATPLTTPLSIATKSLPDGQVSVAYSTTLAATGGHAPYAWSLSVGTLPAGLSLDAPSGTISGVPSAAASGTLSFKVTDSSGPAQGSTANLPLAIAEKLSISTTSLPTGQVGSAYSATLTATGGTAPYIWSLNAGTLPAGLSLDASSGTISGVPTAAVFGTLSFKVTDSSGAAQSTTANLPLTIAGKLSISISSLPNGQIGSAYSATLTATGGAAPLRWALTAGSLPAGLALDASTGVISRTPTTTAARAPLTFSVTDSGTSAQTQSVALTMNVSPASITVAISPARAGLTVTQALSISAATNDNAGVTWSVSPAGGSFNPGASMNGAPVTFTAASAAAVYTLTATSVTDGSRSASIKVGVTDLPGAYTYRNDLARDGANTKEYALAPANVNTSSFGKLFSCTVDGAVYAQPLWVARLTVAGAVHNVVFVATAHDSLYAFDADQSPCTQLWKTNLIDAGHGANAGEMSVPSGTPGYLVGGGLGDITPEVGVIGTPVIDPAGSILYVVSKSASADSTTLYQRLHAIDLVSGNERAGSPVLIAASYPGTGDGGTSVAFSPTNQNQRAGLALLAGTVYIAWGSHEDRPPWYGWMAAYTYNGSAFTQTSTLNVTPNTGEGGIWMGGGAPAADSNGHLYVITGNGNFDATSASAPNNDYGDCFLQLTGALGISSWFAPSDQANDAATDLDFGSGGSATVLNLSGSGPLQHLVVGGGKDTMLYLLDGDNMGGLGDTNARQTFTAGNQIFSTAAFWNNTLYLAAVGGTMQAYAFNASTSLFNPTATSQSPATYGFPGSSPSVSASGTSGSAIVWGLDSSSYCTSQSPACGPAVLHAYSAANLASELWNSSMVGADAAGNAVKFTVPTVANGKVYVGTRGNNTGGTLGSTSISGELDVYGLKPN